MREDLLRNAARTYLADDGDVPAAEIPTDDRFALLDDVELGDLEPPDWIIESVMPANALVQIVGAPKSLKTFLGTDMALHIAAGLDWHGYQVKRGECVYIYAEGASGLQRRVHAWKCFYGITGKIGVYFLPSRVLVNEPSDVSALVDSILGRAPYPRVIFIDTLARNNSGDENSTSDMSGFVRGCDEIREQTGATVAVVHHSGYAAGADVRGRGSSVLPAAADTSILVTRDGERIQLECKFQKDAPEFPMLAFEAFPAHGSLVLKATGLNAGALTGNRRLALDALHRGFGDDGAKHRAWKEATGMANGSFGIALTWLKATTYVKIGAGAKYKVTESGRQALSPHSTSSPQSVQSVQSTSEGGIYTPSMDRDPSLDRGVEAA